MKKYNVTMIGAPSVGKTTIANSLISQSFKDDYIPTIGVSMIKIPFRPNFGSDEKTTWFFVWDTAGMEQYKALAPIYYRDSHCALCVLDVSDECALEKADEWFAFYRATCDKSFPVYFIANKIDLDRKIGHDEIEKFANERNSRFVEVSAKTGEGIEEILPLLASTLGELKVDENSSVAELLDERKEKSSSCC